MAENNNLNQPQMPPPPPPPPPPPHQPQGGGQDQVRPSRQRRIDQLAALADAKSLLNFRIQQAYNNRR